ncbi:acyl-CoA dehydrogenase family protein [Martelella mediterranea]|uniref:Acyl-CoA dehydrogenase, short-chain specific n=1 Tax=Martelella mediterranea DSM 17316 TaxID=1122214 RepID=A0A1U9YWZ4_9HYPH|nr:acyl-CoA dehydrogenase family protein [Martelella mediterranea]AQZ49900.1 Acyl-CoA dehydrogenase, short-chain specific [Martelella mediterranea DSM 17316]
MSYDLNRNADQRQILDAAEAMLAGSYPLARLREGASDNLAEASGFGAFLLGLPEEQGGAGFGIVEEALVHVLFGRHLLTPRSLAAALAVRLAASSGDDALMAAIAAGETAVAPAVRSGNGYLLIDPAQAGMALVFGAERLELVRIADAAPEAGLGHDLSIARMPANDGQAIAETDEAGLLLLSSLLVSAQLLGVAEAARDMAVEYAGIRRQFGSVIGSFQAIKHHCANMAVGTERISALLDMAALALSDGREDAAFQVAALRRLAPKTALANASLCVQIHGGIGFSDEADAHRFVKQAHILGRLGEGQPLLDLPAPLVAFSRA